MLCFSANPHRKVGFEGRFIKTGKGCPGTSRLKLCGSHSPVNVKRLLFIKQHEKKREILARNLEFIFSPDVSFTGAVRAFVKSMKAFREVSGKLQFN